jgi:hypothetical protein
LDNPEPHKSSFAERAKARLSNLEQEERVKQAAAATKEAAARTQEASKTFSRKLTQEDSWEELRGDVEELTEIVRAHHALIVDLIDRIEALEGRAGTESGAGHGG